MTLSRSGSEHTELLALTNEEQICHYLENRDTDRERAAPY